ncbi:uncharacterized protein PODANS_4_4150 [Podospora anserina S mat+]|uniref:Podospora anserina S mat+ genomic DNA chromosome 4, supercontig 4 n=1 Tax=Podospora anserina (strain S / ATCC MYA-4624 / DSM 980 / FGSC 10383) TaxID=515849 RepID=B2AQH2_PODAN|nr:uncharacterized protein PODANS_4_4150 [Podospora anserina S mat+]CAP66399.1 unnamed protein product [Podospora anserina S mat+]CDP28128.1 Putative protein of unknown function [Podospora anserina S mat+]
MKVVYPFWIVSSLCQVAQVGLSIWGFNDIAGRITKTEYFELAVSLVLFLAEALQNISDILLFIAFVEIGSGFVLCLNGAKKSPIRRRLRFAAFALGIILLALALTHFGVRLQADIAHRSQLQKLNDLHVTDGLFDPASEAARLYFALQAGAQDAHFDSLIKSSHLHNAFNICLWITSLPILGFASYVLHHTKENIMLKKVAALYLTSTILTFCRLLVTMGINLSEYENHSLIWSGNIKGHTGIRTDILPLVEAFFNYTLMFIVLTLLFVVAIRKRRGLWSNSQMTWDASNKLSNVATGSSPTSETPGYSDDGLQEHGFCLESQQTETSSHPTDPQPSSQPLLSSAPPALPRQPPPAAHLDPEPISTAQQRIPRRPLAPSIPLSPTKPSSPSGTPSSPQSIHPVHGGFLTRQRTIEELDAQKVLVLEMSPIHHPHRIPSSDDGEEVADGFQMQNRAHLNVGESSANAMVATRYQAAQGHDPSLEEDTELETVVDGFQMGSAQRRTKEVESTTKSQKSQDHDEPLAESDVVADGFQMQSKLPSYDEAAPARTGLGYLREKDDQDKKARGRARSF